MNTQLFDNVTGQIKKIRLSKDVAILLSRIIIGVIFIIHGVLKWRIGPAVIAGFLKMVNIPFAGPLAWVLIAVEVFGGLAIMLGIGMRTAARLLIIVMLIAIVTVKLPIGLIGGSAQGPGYELDLALITTLLLLIQTGAGVFSVKTLVARYYKKS